jgi:uncharacterized membrane protein
MPAHDVTIESTTGTAAITLSTSHTPGRVDITLEDGSSQAYNLADLAAAVEQLIYATLSTDLLRMQHAGWIDPTSPAVDVVEEAAQYLHGAPRVLEDRTMREAIVRACAERLQRDAAQ